MCLPGGPVGLLPAPRIDGELRVWVLSVDLRETVRLASEALEALRALKKRPGTATQQGDQNFGRRSVEPGGSFSPGLVSQRSRRTCGVREGVVIRTDRTNGLTIGSRFILEVAINGTAILDQISGAREWRARGARARPVPSVLPRNMSSKLSCPLAAHHNHIHIEFGTCRENPFDGTALPKQLIPGPVRLLRKRQFSNIAFQPGMNKRHRDRWRARIEKPSTVAASMAG